MALDEDGRPDPRQRGIGDLLRQYLRGRDQPNFQPLAPHVGVCVNSTLVFTGFIFAGFSWWGGNQRRRGYFILRAAQ